MIVSPSWAASRCSATRCSPRSDRDVDLLLIATEPGEQPARADDLVDGAHGVGYKNGVEHSPDHGALREAEMNGTDFVIQHQGSDGLWRDFFTLAGESTDWATAYIAVHRDW